ncbi:MAG: anaerobic ribonucleoside-triphosphate reductase activating protein [Clostridia bacterium]|nr:anaerobic ribonucleoside-triphosphate reductase activating protein [Clostridia bacterium]
MIIKGLQKLTLLDFPGQVACTLFTGGCNFRCPFCHNASLVISPDDVEEYSEEEILDFLKKRIGILDGVAITGGEPLLQKDIYEFMSKIRAMGYKIKLDTNGSFPHKLKEIVKAELCDYVALDVKNSPRRYAETVGIKDYQAEKIAESVKFLMESGVDYEFRTTIVSELHSEEDIEEIGRWIQGAKRWYLQNFVDSGALICPNLSGADKETMEKYLSLARKYVPEAELRGL